LDDKAGVARARKSGHIHLDEVVERQELFLNQHILFTHFSKRYSPDEIREIFARRLPTSFMERVSLLLPDPTRLPG
jgi:ribonuclease Z